MPNLIIPQERIARVVVPFVNNSQVVVCDNIIGLVRFNELIAVYKRGVLIYRSGVYFDYDLLASFEDKCSSVTWDKRPNPVSQPDDYFTLDLLY